MHNSNANPAGAQLSRDLLSRTASRTVLEGRGTGPAAPLRKVL